MTAVQRTLDANEHPGFQVLVAIKTVSEGNWREHRMAKAARVKHQREETLEALNNRSTRCPHQLPVTITLTRISPGELDDDNLRMALKAVRDACAQWIGVDDRKRELVAYEYLQQKGKGYGVRIRVDPRGQA